MRKGDDDYSVESDADSLLLIDEPGADDEDGEYIPLTSSGQDSSPKKSSGSLARQKSPSSSTHTPKYKRSDSAHERIKWTDEMREDLLECKRWELQQQQEGEEGKTGSIWPAVKQQWEKKGYGYLERSERHLRDQMRQIEIQMRENGEFDPGYQNLLNRQNSTTANNYSNNTNATPKRASSSSATIPTTSKNNNTNNNNSKTPPNSTPSTPLSANKKKKTAADGSPAKPIEWTRKMKRDLLRCKESAEREYVRQYLKDIRRMEKRWHQGGQRRYVGNEFRVEEISVMIKERWEAKGYAYLNRSARQLRERLRIQGDYVKNLGVLQEMAQLQLLQEQEWKRRDKKEDKKYKKKKSRKEKRTSKKKDKKQKVKKEVAAASSSTSSSTSSEEDEKDSSENSNSDDNKRVSSSSTSEEEHSLSSSAGGENEYARIEYQEVDQGPKVLMPVVRKSQRVKSKKSSSAITISDSESGSEENEGESDANGGGKSHPMLTKKRANYDDDQYDSNFARYFPDSNNNNNNNSNSKISEGPESLSASRPLVKKQKTSNNHTQLLLERPTACVPELSDISEEHENEKKEEESGMNIEQPSFHSEIDSPLPPAFSTQSDTSNPGAIEKLNTKENESESNEKEPFESRHEEFVPEQPKPKNSFLVNFLLKK